MPKPGDSLFEFQVTSATRTVSLELIGDAVFVEAADTAPGGPDVQVEIPAEFLFRWVDAQRAVAASK